MDALGILLEPYNKKRIEIFRNTCRDKSVLDVGFWLTDELPTRETIKAAGEWTGIDSKRSRVRKAVSEGHNAVLGDFSKKMKPLGRFDVVVLGEVIEHTDNMGQMIENSKKHLKKGGVILFSTPNCNWNTRGLFTFLFPLLSFLRKSGILDNINDEHILWHSPETMETLAKTHGLEITWLSQRWHPSLIGVMK